VASDDIDSWEALKQLDGAVVALRAALERAPKRRTPVVSEEGCWKKS
jgi:hypothetical protein